MVEENPKKYEIYPKNFDKSLHKIVSLLIRDILSISNCQIINKNSTLLNMPKSLFIYIQPPILAQTDKTRKKFITKFPHTVCVLYFWEAFIPYVWKAFIYFIGTICHKIWFSSFHSLYMYVPFGKSFSESPINLSEKFMRKMKNHLIFGERKREQVKFDFFVL